MLRRPALVALPLVLLVSVLTACTDTARIPPAEPSSAAAPLFASDEEALEAATAAYEEFLRVSGEILRDGGADPERLKPLVSDQVYASEAEGFATLQSNGWRATGQSVLVGSSLQQHQPGPVSEVEVIAYMCVSVEETDVVDELGRSQIDPNRPTLLAFEVIYSSSVDTMLVLERKSSWSQGVVCEG